MAPLDCWCACRARLTQQCAGEASLQACRLSGVWHSVANKPDEGCVNAPAAALLSRTAFPTARLKMRASRPLCMPVVLSTCSYTSCISMGSSSNATASSTALLISASRPAHDARSNDVAKVLLGCASLDAQHSSLAVLSHRTSCSVTKAHDVQVAGRWVTQCTHVSIPAAQALSSFACDHELPTGAAKEYARMALACEATLQCVLNCCCVRLVGLIWQQVHGHACVSAHTVEDGLEGEDGGAGLPQEACNSSLDVSRVFCRQRTGGVISKVHPTCMHASA